VPPAPPLDPLTGETFAAIDTDMARHRVVIRTEMSHNLPLVRGDAVALQQVLLNLLVDHRVPSPVDWTNGAPKTNDQLAP
jgi:hypothetical protein